MVAFGGRGDETPMNLLMVSSIVTLHGTLVAMDDFETGRRLVDESFGISLVLGGAFVALLAVLVFFLYTCRKGR